MKRLNKIISLLIKFDNLFTELLGNTNVTESPSEQIFDLCAGIIDIIKKAKIVDVTFGIVPELVFLRKIQEWFSKYTGESVLIKVSTDSSILGGVQFSYDGSYFDYSVKKIMGTYLDHNKSNVLSRL